MPSIVVQDANGNVRSFANVNLPKGAQYYDAETRFTGVVIVSNA